MGAQAHLATQSAKPKEIERRWYVIDAEGLVLGRMCTRVASVLKGKHRVFVTPHVDCGDHVIVINCEKVKLTGRKLEQKVYHRHSGYTGSIKSVTAGQLLEGPHPDRVVRKAVYGMLPKNSLGRQMMTKLRVYKGSAHPHEAQKPEELTLA